MSMEHKAYLFDTITFNKELKELILISGSSGNPALLKKFIDKNIGKIYSPYTGELLNCDWEKEIENGSIQELADFACTRYYMVEEEMGLGYSWDALIDALKMLHTKFLPDYYVLGQSLATEKFQFNPGGMGLGFIYAEDIFSMYNELVDLKQEFIENGMPVTSDILYEVNFRELIEAYDELILMYKEANESNHGLLMTF